ncbi:hypothetical protein NDN16_18640 [Aureimonas altamirensis]|uniref:hypothetical protein n=1 Tax=Aureimonas altamirensis TaxID=370622 RepID=UPI00203726DE|nr:hypothetical protein [Aureimonas altamirensis]MCM2505685.1 hypothetical protein [Aureimonas altamirensis]
MRRIAIVVIGLLGSAELASARPAVPALERLLSRLSADVVASPRAFNRTFGANLIKDDGGRYSARSFASDVLLDGIPFREIELRSPRRGYRPKVGPILIMNVEHEAAPCIPKAEVRRAYPDLEWVGAPSPHAMDPDEMLERRQGAARLVFGFPAFGADCLRTIIYRFDDPL